MATKRIGPQTAIARRNRVAGPVVSVLLLISLTSCVTYQDQRTRQTAVQEREDLLLLREDLRRLAGSIEGLELEVDRLQRNVTAQRAEQADLVRTRVQGVEARLADQDRRIQQVDAAREADKKEIIERLSTTVEQLIRSQPPPTPRATSGGRRPHSGYGYEHVVQPGETLTHIATAYGVTARVIVEANQLQNPDRLRVGQTLFIPE